MTNTMSFGSKTTILHRKPPPCNVGQHATIAIIQRMGYRANIMKKATTIDKREVEYESMDNSSNNHDTGSSKDSDILTLENLEQHCDQYGSKRSLDEKI
jgi:hypothetical protein